MLDLALLDHTADELHWERAVARAQWVGDRLAPDPEHGALIFHPGRLDPRNCSTSAIDSGECTDALVRLLQHERAALLLSKTRDRLHDAVERNAETYLRTAVLEKGITNQRLWAAMGLASAWSLLQRPAWRSALERSIQLALNEQRADGSWGYQPNAVIEGAHPGAADLTVYYHSRCLAFLMHIEARVPEVRGHGLREAIERGLKFLWIVMTPDGLKPLSLEGKRWFWAGSYEAGSAAYDAFALLRGASAFGADGLHERGLAAWRQLARHQRSDGAIVACLEPGNSDFVCPDFHTADLAWTAQVLHELPDPHTSRVSAHAAVRVSNAPDAGIIRIDGVDRNMLVRTSKLPANTHFGGAVGGGALAAVVDGSGVRLLRPSDGRCTVVPRRSVSRALGGLRRFLRANRPRREGSQLLFAARLLVQQGRILAAGRRLWQGWFGPMVTALQDIASPDWAIVCDRVGSTGEVVLRGRVSRHDGTVPGWAANLTVDRRYHVDASGAHVRLQLTGTAPDAAYIRYLLPEAARSVQVESEGLEVTHSARLVTARPTNAALRLDVTYLL